MATRHSIGFAAAALAFAVGTAVEHGWSFGWIAFGVGLALLALAFADRLPRLNELPPPWGAIKRPDAEFHLESTGALECEMPSSGPEDVIIAVGLAHKNQRPIQDVVINFYLVGSTAITRCGQRGEEWNGEGTMLTADGPYWSQATSASRRTRSCGSGSPSLAPGDTQSSWSSTLRTSTGRRETTFHIQTGCLPVIRAASP